VPLTFCAWQPYNVQAEDSHVAMVPDNAWRGLYFA
jgi:hypothetical protein